jgi:5-methyltetrahydrofolate--homocysteine methyltransferase
MKDTVAALRDAGPDVKIMIGGGQIDEQIRQYTGADAYGRDAMVAVSLAKDWA